MEQQRYVLALPWVIPITSDATEADGTWTTTPSVSIGPYNFVWTRLAIQTTISGGIWSIMIKDEADSKNFMISAIRSNLLVPLDARMVDLPRSWVFKGHSTIYVEATNVGSEEDTLYMAFHGYLEQ